jgi:hypothetical protein
VKALLDEGLEEIGETNIVADRTADGEVLARIGHDRVARRESRALAILRAVGRRDVEHVDLAISRDLGAGAIENHSCVVHPIRAFDLLEHRSGMEEDRVGPGELLHRRIGRAAGQRLGRRELRLAIAAHEVEAFGKADPVRPFLEDGLLDQLASDLDVRGLVGDRVHLDQGNFHRALQETGILMHSEPLTHLSRAGNMR